MFAGNEIVLVVPADSTLGLTSFQDLTKADVKKIGYGDPKVAPHGVAAEEILNKLGIFDQVKPKVVYAAERLPGSRSTSPAAKWTRASSSPPKPRPAGDKVKVVATADQAWYTQGRLPDLPW